MRGNGGGGARTRVRGRPSQISSEVCVKVQKEPACRCVVGAGSRLGGLARPLPFPPPPLTRALSPLSLSSGNSSPLCPTHLCVRARPWVAPILGSGRAGARPGTPERVRETHAGRPPAEGREDKRGASEREEQTRRRPPPPASLTPILPRAPPPPRHTPLPTPHPPTPARLVRGRACVRAVSPARGE